MNIRVVRGKIKAFSNVKKITQAMQLVSAIKMKKAQQEALEAAPYQQFLEESVNRFVKGLQPEQSDLLVSKNPSGKALYIVISTNKGLCGAFNTNLVRHLAREHDVRKGEFISMGKKGAIILNQLGGKILADFSENPPLDDVNAVFDLALEKFLSGDYASVNLVYNRFASSSRYIPLVVQLLPIDMTEEKKEEAQKKEKEESQKEYLVEPSPEEVVKALLANYVEEKIRFAIIQTFAGEHSARMIAMKNATDNATDVIYNLTLLRNKLRQQKITYELLDMITAKESVENLN